MKSAEIDFALTIFSIYFSYLFLSILPYFLKSEIYLKGKFDIAVSIVVKCDFLTGGCHTATC